MNILAFDTATDNLSVMVVSNGQHYVETCKGKRQHAEKLLQLIEQVLRDAGISLMTVDMLALTNGPGSFVGVRLACSVAQSIAAVYNLPIIAISTLQAYAQAAWHQFNVKRVAVLQNAFMNQVCLGVYSLDNKKIMKKNMDDSLCRPENVPLKNIETCFFAGDGWQQYKDLLAMDVSSSKIIHYTVQDLLPLIENELCNKNTITAEELSVVYLNNFDSYLC